jgi:hypothetical protein
MGLLYSYNMTTRNRSAWSRDAMVMIWILLWKLSPCSDCGSIQERLRPLDLWGSREIQARKFRRICIEVEDSSVRTRATKRHQEYGRRPRDWKWVGHQENEKVGRHQHSSPQSLSYTHHCKARYFQLRCKISDMKKWTVSSKKRSKNVDEFRGDCPRDLFSPCRWATD